MVETIRSSERPAFTSLITASLLRDCWATSRGQNARNTRARKLLRIRLLLSSQNHSRLRWGGASIMYPRRGDAQGVSPPERAKGTPLLDGLGLAVGLEGALGNQGVDGLIGKRLAN